MNGHLNFCKIRSQWFVLWWVNWDGVRHTLMKIDGTGTYGSWDTSLPQKPRQSLYFYKNRSQCFRVDPISKGRQNSFDRVVYPESLSIPLNCLILPIHHNLFITWLLGSKVKTELATQPCCIQTKMSRSYRKMTKNGHFCLDTTLLGSTFKPSYIQNHLIMNCLIKRFRCIRKGMTQYYKDRQLRKIDMLSFLTVLPLFSKQTTPVGENLLPQYMDPWSKAITLKCKTLLPKRVNYSFKSSPFRKEALFLLEWSPLEGHLVNFLPLF